MGKIPVINNSALHSLNIKTFDRFLKDAKSDNFPIRSILCKPTEKVTRHGFWTAKRYAAEIFLVITMSDYENETKKVIDAFDWTFDKNVKRHIKKKFHEMLKSNGF